MRLWTNTEGGCLAAVVGSLIGRHPGDLPQTDQIAVMDAWLQRTLGRRLEPVRPAETWGESYPSGHWIALEARRPGVAHAVLCKGNEVVHDPGSGWSGSLYPANFAHARNRELPLGYRLVEA
jgi:hypothetical protein